MRLPGIKPIPKLGALLVVGSLLGGCGSGDFGDLQAFMNEVDSRPAPPIAPLKTFQPAEPFAYEAMGLRSPFEPPVVVKPSERPRGPQVKPNPNRVKQYLEQFTIANLSMVGTLSQGPSMYALIRDSDGGVHRVQAGDYMGTDHGRIQSIDEAAIELVEIVPDGTGSWVERIRTVSLGSGEKG
ncbi:MAG: pilus assembly protein PilP [Pseudomonadales bacterium]